MLILNGREVPLFTGTVGQLKEQYGIPQDHILKRMLPGDTFIQLYNTTVLLYRVSLDYVFFTYPGDVKL